MKSFFDGSVYSGELPEGCKQCALGAKMVLFVSGRCDAGCFYCPLSSEKKVADISYADEMPVHNINDIILEAKLIDAMGTGITGGDPLKYLDRTLKYISLLKTEFGSEHHIHLYTITGSRSSISSLAEAGLDEIRFHIPETIWDRADDSVYLDRINWAIESGLSVGIEVPSLPNFDDRLEKLVSFAERSGVNFVNLNELEFSETNYVNLLQRGYDVKNDVSAGASGSEDLAKRIIEMFPDYNVHYCSASFKDGTQLRNRLLRRARNIAEDIDMITEDGTIVKGTVEGGNIKEIVNDLRKVGLSKGEYRINYARNRVEVSSEMIRNLRNKIPYALFEVEEYPTWDQLEVERQPI